ncbi:hypothetical protein GGI12_005207 [Dipsacomyces acuminosporus]|nr:hypothetical protein GGI12_005207 [Dipsacomyces acuminosporus]
MSESSAKAPGHSGSDEGIIEGDFGVKYRILDGIPMPLHITPERYELSRTIKTRGTDICFASYPKSGTTWLAYILVLLTGSKGATLNTSYDWVESQIGYPRTREELENLQSPRLFKSHMSYEMALGGVPAENPCKYIYVARNPKDVCASYYHFQFAVDNPGNYKGDWDPWFQMFAEGRVPRGDWFNHVLSWWRHRDCENILFLKYEDMKKDIDAELKKIASFIGVEVSPSQLEQIKEQIKFSSMKSNEFCVMKGNTVITKFYRKGKVGSWKEMFTVQQSEHIDRLYKERMPSDLAFDFE